MFSKSRAALLACLVAAFLVQSAWTQDKQTDPIVERMKKDLFFLASEECEGRGVGTQGLNLAGEYIAAKFKKAGLKPGGKDGTYFQPFPMATQSQPDGESMLVLNGPKGERIVLKQGVDFTVIGTSAPGLLAGTPLVFAGYGVNAKEIDYDDYRGLDVKGKAVIAIRRVPRWSDKERPFDGANKDELAAQEIKQNRGEHHRAAAVILVNDSSELPNDGLVATKISAARSTLSTPFVHVKRAAIDKALKSVTGSDLADMEKAIDDDLKPRSADVTGWTVDLNVKIKRKVVPVRNIIGILEGSGPLKDEYVVVGAHYDHVGYGEFGSRDGPKGKGKLHYGADDNASGSTSVIELARRFAAKKDREGRTMVFITFSAEESGLVGSYYYTRTDPIYPLKNTVAMFNLDMVGRLQPDVTDGAKPKLLVEGHDTAKSFDKLVTELNPGFNIIKTRTRGFVASDQLPFYLQKIPVMFFWTGEHPDYHSPRDTPDKINVLGMKKIADYAELVVDHLRTDPKRPEYVKVALGKFSGTNTGQGPRLRLVPDETEGNKGVLVSMVIEGGPADAAGLKMGDIIIELAGRPTPTIMAYQTITASLKSGVEVPITVLRNDKELRLKVTPTLPK